MSLTIEDILIDNYNLRSANQSLTARLDYLVRTKSSWNFAERNGCQDVTADKRKSKNKINPNIKIGSHRQNHNQDSRKEIIKHAKQIDFHILENISFFHSIPKEALNYLLLQCNYLEYKEGDSIIEYGQQGNELFIILEGIVSVWSGDKKHIFAILRKNDLFGECAVFFHQSRVAHVKAETRVRLLVLNRSAMESCLKTWPSIREIVMFRGIKRILNSIQSLQDFTNEDYSCIAKEVSLETYTINQILLPLKSTQSVLYILISGEVRVMDRSDHTVETYVGGSIFSNIPLFSHDEVESDVYLIAFKPSELLVMNRLSFRRVVERVPDFKKLIEKQQLKGPIHNFFNIQSQNITECVHKNRKLRSITEEAKDPLYDDLPPELIGGKLNRINSIRATTN